ncbi:MAG: hypothetical protein ACO1OQ_07490 [Rufibacter sp.]
MRRAYLIFLAVLVLLGIKLIFFQELAVSVIPGWHTPIFPPFFVITSLAQLWVIILTVGYFVLDRKGQPLSKKLILFHCLLTFPLLIYLQLPLDLLLHIYDLPETPFVPLAILFLVGQLVFLWFFIAALVYKNT